MAKIKEIASIADLELAMKELQEHDSVVRIGQADLAKTQASLREGFDTIYGDNVIRKEELEAMIHAYVDKNKKSVFSDGRKTREFPYGSISIRIGQLAIALRNGVTMSAVMDAARKLKLVITRTPPEELDKDAVKKHIKAGHINDDSLKELGLVATQSETINIKLNDKA